MANKKTLPEHIVTDKENDLSKLAKKALAERVLVNRHTSTEKDIKGKMADYAEGFREGRFEDGEVIGKLSIAPPNQTACRVEFRINNGSLETSEMDALDQLFEGARSELFEKVKIVDKIVDPSALIKQMETHGLNPWDYLKLSVKSNQDQIVIDQGVGIETAEAILPKTGFLATVAEMFGRFTKDAKEYLRLYLREALSPTIILGTKTKSNG